MAIVVDYEYIGEVSTLDAGRNLASDTTNGYTQEMPGVNTFLINAANQVINYPEGGGSGIAGWSTDVSWSASDYNTVAWGSGSIYLPDGTSLSVSSGNTGNMGATTYIYYDRDTSAVATTTTASASVGENKILLCVATPTSSGKRAEFQAFGTDDQSTFIHAYNIAANTITGNEIAANTITAYELDVDYLSAISADLGSITAGDITGTTITAGSTSSAAVKLYPYSSTQGRIEFYYNGSVVGYINGTNLSGFGGAITINGSVKYLPDTTVTYELYANNRLKIPVGTDLYG